MDLTLQKFPFLKHINRHNPGRDEILKSFYKLKKSYLDSHRHITNLKGKDLFELFGFVSTLQAAFESFTGSEQAQIEEHFIYIEETTTIWRQVIALVTSRYFLSMVGCWTASIFLPPVAAICGAIGLGFAIPGLHGLVQQTLRLNDFNRTGEYDRSVYGRYIVGILLSGGMYAVFAQSAVPGFVKNVRGFHVKTADLIRKVRLSPRSVLGTTKDLMKGELEILQKYFYYNLKDFGSDGVVDLASQQFGGVSMRMLLPSIRTAFQQTLFRVEARSPQIFLYSDVLRITRTAFP